MEYEVEVTNEFDNIPLQTNNVFGEIEFSGLNQIAKYARLEDESDEKALKHMLIKKWRLRIPKLVINIYGGHFEKKKTLRMIFKKGLWKAAESTGCWIVTGGFNFGIMKLVGEALRDYTDAYGGDYLLAIGVSSLFGIRNKEVLTSAVKEEHGPVIYKSEEEDVASEFSQPRSHNEETLDPNHTHFLMLDKGLPHIKGQENVFRSQFEQYISNWQDEEGTNIKIPMCGLLIGGDRYNIHQVYFALVNNHCPIIVIKGTSGAADVLASAWEAQFSDNNGKGKEKEEVDEEAMLEKKIEESLEFLKKNDQDTDVYDFSVEIEMLKEIIKTMSHLVEIFDMDDDFDLDRRMIASLLSTAGTNYTNEQLNLEQLKICLTLNRPDIARDKIFLENKKWKKGDLNSYMYQALMDDRHEFVRLFLEQGFSLEEFLTVFMLEKLYTDQLKKINSKIAIFYKLWERYYSHRMRNKGVSLKEVGKVIRVLVGDFFHPDYLSKEFLDQMKDHFVENEENGENLPIKKGNSADYLNKSQLKIFGRTIKREMRTKKVNLKRPAKDLMIWSILVGKLQMAELFWSMEKEPIAGALLSKMMLTALQKRTDDFTDKEDFQNYASFFELRAEGVLNECYREDEQRAQQLIHRELKHYGANSCIVLSAQGQSIRFMAHPCCQDFLTSIWMGNLSPKNAIGRFATGILLGLTLPFLLPKLIHYKTSKKNGIESGESSKQTASTDERSRRVSVKCVKLEMVSMEPEKSQLYSYQEKYQHSFKFRFVLALQRIRDFYMAPAVRFVYNTLAYISFLIIFSYMLLFDFQISITPIEGIIIAWMITLLFEEIKQATISGISFSTYISDGWNKLDCIAVTLYIVGFILRLTSCLKEQSSQYFALNDIKPELYDELFVAGRIFMSFSLFAYYIRLMYIFSFHIALGPKLIMIGKMVMNDLIPFMVILLVFVFGYGVTSYSISYPQGHYTPLSELRSTPNFSEPSPMSHQTIFLNFLTKAYYPMFGEFGLEEMQGKDDGCSKQGECPHYTAKWLVPIMLGVYVLLTNILMFNLLIAMFSRTYEMIENSSLYYWNYQRYKMIQIYVERSPLAPPLIIIWQVYKLILFFYRRYKRINPDELEGPFKKSYRNNLKKERELCKWEHMKAMDYLRNLEFSESGGKQQGINMKSVVLRTSAAPAGGAAVNVNANASAMQQQMSEATGTLSLEMEKRFREIDTGLQRFTDVENQLTDLQSTLTLLSDVIGSIVERQLEITAKLNGITLCKCSTEPKITEESIQMAVQHGINETIPTWFAKASEEIIQTALNTTPVEISPSSLDSIAKQQWLMLKEDMALVQRAIATDESVSFQSLTADLELQMIEEMQHIVIPDVTDSQIGRIIERRCLNHRMWRISPFNFEKYPGMRMNVPSDKIPWNIIYHEYFPFDTSEEVLIFPTETSHDNSSIYVRELVFNKFDDVHKIRRQSLIGQYGTDSSTGAPLNPMGRTGLKAKGLLPHWGPNHALIPIITRWCRLPSGETVFRNGLPVLETITLTHNKQLSLPWYLADHLPNCDFDQCVPLVLKTFISRRLNDVTTKLNPEQECKSIENAQVVQIFKGYWDDHLNADNGWIEAVVVNIHENEDWKYTDDLLQVFEEPGVNELIRWMEISYNTSMRPSHNDLLKSVALSRNAFF